jgi:hypothetical protein
MAAGSIPAGGPIFFATNVYVLFNKRAGVFFLGLKPRARSASVFRPNKTRPASLLNGFKHDYKFNRYTALLVFFI